MQATPVVQRFLRWTIPAIVLGIVAILVIINFLQVQNLQHAASGIRVGDTRAEVVKLLGSARVTYTTGYPPAGGAPTVWGSCYGGIFNSIRSTVDGYVYFAFNGLPRWYQRYISQDATKDWPLTIEFNNNGKVIAIRY